MTSRDLMNAPHTPFLTPTLHLICRFFLLVDRAHGSSRFFPQSRRDKDVKRQLTGHGVVTVLALRNFNSWAGLIHWSRESPLRAISVYVIFRERITIRKTLNYRSRYQFRRANFRNSWSFGMKLFYPFRYTFQNLRPVTKTLNVLRIYFNNSIVINIIISGRRNKKKSQSCVRNSNIASAIFNTPRLPLSNFQEKEIPETWDPHLRTLQPTSRSHNPRNILAEKLTKISLFAPEAEDLRKIRGCFASLIAGTITSSEEKREGRCARGREIFKVET